MSTDHSRPDPEFDQPRDSEVRADAVVEDQGGLPDDNPFAEVVRDLRDDGHSWTEIFDALDAVDRVVDKAALEEDTTILPEWRVTVIVPDRQATSGERYETHTFAAETAREAEEEIENRKEGRVAPGKTEQVGTVKVS